MFLTENRKKKNFFKLYYYTCLIYKKGKKKLRSKGYIMKNISESLALYIFVASDHLNYKTRGHEFGETTKQGSRKSKIGLELTKSGCHVRSSEF